MTVEISISGTRGGTVKVGEITSTRPTSPYGIHCHYHHEDGAIANCQDFISSTRGKPKITVSEGGRGKFSQKDKFTR